MAPPRALAAGGKQQMKKSPSMLFDLLVRARGGKLGAGWHGRGGLWRGGTVRTKSGRRTRTQTETDESKLQQKLRQNMDGLKPSKTGHGRPSEALNDSASERPCSKEGTASEMQCWRNVVIAYVHLPTTARHGTCMYIHARTCTAVP